MAQKRERLHGGGGDRRPDSAFDSEQLAEGIKVEMEHTTDPLVAKEIAKDHLTEDPDYYIKLRKAKLSRKSDYNRGASMSYVKDYANGVRYAMLSNEEIKPFFDSHVSGNEQAMLAATDKFNDNNDPRGRVLARHFGLDSHPNAKFWETAKQSHFIRGPKGRIAPVVVQDGHFAPGYELGRSWLSFNPVLGTDAEGKQEKAVRAVWAHDRIDQDPETASWSVSATPFYESLFTHDEAREMANQLPPEHGDRLHKMLDSHFG